MLCPDATFRFLFFLISFLPSTSSATLDELTSFLGVNNGKVSLVKENWGGKKKEEDEEKEDSDDDDEEQEVHKAL